MEITLSKYCVRGSDGTVDTRATLSKFSADLDKFIAERETEQTVIAGAVHAVFDKNPGVRVNMPYLTSQALTVLNATPANYKALTERVQDFVRSNSQGAKAEDGSVERPDSLFIIGKGKGGGCIRRADLKPSAELETESE